LIGVQTTPHPDGISSQPKTKLIIEGNSGDPDTNDP
jgi:hypothetical protein